jgi:hypothetical protein
MIDEDYRKLIDGDLRTNWDLEGMIYGFKQQGLDIANFSSVITINTFQAGIQMVSCHYYKPSIKNLSCRIIMTDSSKGSSKEG